MNKLPSNFEMKKYGLHVRLVKESDAGFIIKLRTDKRLSKFIHDTSPSIQNQIKWTIEYKKREREGKDYYFIYSKDNKPLGLNRIYNIHDEIFTTGSWVFSPEAPIECMIASSLIPRIIAFDILHLKMEDDYDGCHEDNKKVLKLMEMEGIEFYGSIQDIKGKYLLGRLTKERFEPCRIRIEKLLNLK